MKCRYCQREFSGKNAPTQLRFHEGVCLEGPMGQTLTEWMREHAVDGMMLTVSEFDKQRPPEFPSARWLRGQYGWANLAEKWGLRVKSPRSGHGIKESCGGARFARILARVDAWIAKEKALLAAAELEYFQSYGPTVEEDWQERRVVTHGRVRIERYVTLK